MEASFRVLGIKKPVADVQLVFFVAGTGLEPVSASGG